MNRLEQLWGWWFGHAGVVEPEWDRRMGLFGCAVFVVAFAFWSWQVRRKIAQDLFHVFFVVLYSLATMVVLLGWPVVLLAVLGLAPFTLIIWGVLKYNAREYRQAEIVSRLTGEPLPDEFRKVDRAMQHR